MSCGFERQVSEPKAAKYANRSFRRLWTPLGYVVRRFSKHDLSESPHTTADGLKDSHLFMSTCDSTVLRVEELKDHLVSDEFGVGTD
jgi:hypothetical protein